MLGESRRMAVGPFQFTEKHPHRGSNGTIRCVEGWKQQERTVLVTCVGRITAVVTLESDRRTKGAGRDVSNPIVACHRWSWK